MTSEIKQISKLLAQERKDQVVTGSPKSEEGGPPSENMFSLHDQKLPSTQVKTFSLPEPLTPKPPAAEAWMTNKNPYSDFEQSLDLLDEKIRSQETMYAKFMARRHSIA